MKNKEFKVALVLFTSGIDYDDRIRKEILSIQKIYPFVSFKIFAVEDGKNREESGVTSYGVPYRIPYLKTRDKYASGTHTIAKAWDLYTSIRNDIKAFDAVWCADCETFLFVLLTFRKKLIWDLHELPFVFMKSPLMKILFKYLERRVDVMIHANGSRLEYLKDRGYVNNMSKQFYLRNYPQFNEIDTDYDDAYNSAKTNQKITLIITIVASLIIIVYVINRDKKIKKNYLIHKENNNIIYYRDIPSNLDPYFAATLVFSHHRHKVNMGDVYSALLLNLVRKNYIELKKIDETKNWVPENINVNILYIPNNIIPTLNNTTLNQAISDKNILEPKVVLEKRVNINGINK